MSLRSKIVDAIEEFIGRQDAPLDWSIHSPDDVKALARFIRDRIDPELPDSITDGDGDSWIRGADGLYRMYGDGHGYTQGDVIRNWGVRN